jgi:hypothetical protein
MDYLCFALRERRETPISDAPINRSAAGSGVVVRLSAVLELVTACMVACTGVTPTVNSPASSHRAVIVENLTIRTI